LGHITCGPSPPSPLSPKVHGTLLSSRTTDTPIRTRVCSYYSSRPPPKSGDRGDNGDRPRDLSIRDTNTDEDCDTHDDELQRFAKGVRRSSWRRESVRWARSMGSTRLSTCEAGPCPEPPASPRLFWRFPPILHQYTSAIRPDDEARAIHWITFYAYYALCAPPRDAWLPTQPSDSGGPSTPPAHTRSLNGDYCARSV
jgi:hypothetical protein